MEREEPRQNELEVTICSTVNGLEELDLKLLSFQ